MISSRLLIALVYYFAYIIYVYCAIYIMTLNAKAALNRLFLIICIAMCVWALSFSIAGYTDDLRTVYVWRMFAALGWGTIYSFILHFIILLTGRKKKWLNRKWVYVALYLPALINILVFSLVRSVAVQQYNFIMTPLGWTSVHQGGNILGWFFNLYYFIFSVAILYLIWKWRSEATNATQKNKAPSCFSLFFFL